MSEKKRHATRRGKRREEGSRRHNVQTKVFTIKQIERRYGRHEGKMRHTQRQSRRRSSEEHEGGKRRDRIATEPDVRRGRIIKEL
ncbi:hypothetical protein HETIRDRAFT_411347 [Heterobasidion irregulare TC 32-1]|uniref:Uncharacterized protein n=1 Tax=Heterobasidion irregulare (strain TC 32-1) TaxID=747525 RepID=W4JZJ4_HETIT|nr:uncharacterized protein HETIRDRAFT_411347 [Heterobasidion irregulare TC 32-1]ETW78271.1 hypothetical protein HETIRDRAFT_411347 [Heterobasidion irregulare TC 32-1]